MTNLWLILFGMISGVLGGMGMGGGTLLIPLLSFLDIEQQTIQAINLISFLPMAAFALIIHFKNGLVSTKNTGYLIFPAVAFAVLGAFLAEHASGEFLRLCFGVLLLSLGVWQMAVSIKTFVKNKKVKAILDNQQEQLKNIDKEETTQQE